jgi:hypothetical protein
VTMNDFRIDLGPNNVKVYPSLLQGNTSTGQNTDTYLDVGRSTNGVVYFEQDDSWGGCFPRIYRGKKTRIRLAVTDVFGTKHKKSFWIPVVSLDEARKYNPSFGGTYATMRSQ